MTSLVENKVTVFCNRQCLAKYRGTNPNPKAVAALNRVVQTPEFRAFMSEHAKERQRDGSPLRGYKHTDETRAKMRASGAGKHVGSLNGMHGRKHSDSSREKMSDGHSKNLVEGKGYVYGGTRHAKGWHTSSKGNDGQPMFYRSSWELAMMKNLDSDASVTKYEYERVRIVYYDTINNKRNYVPDFLITYAIGPRVLCEIKPRQFLDNEKTRLKTAAAQRWCMEQASTRYELVTGEMLRERGILAQEAS